QATPVRTLFVSSINDSTFKRISNDYLMFYINAFSLNGPADRIKFVAQSISPNETNYYDAFKYISETDWYKTLKSKDQNLIQDVTTNINDNKLNIKSGQNKNFKVWQMLNENSVFEGIITSDYAINIDY